ncbi:hypothetical protein BV22DRAFT_1032314 [Leucogyrophana mollusca]|uniref:Uncharacterized protein n=1 Tax=Leucogyrophana mollusca TaxID=85980 RepID=A0ACB8BPA7_9AGAM|nr:hypothetical protein BV22DRAFT_1032314 [Leucogyrophana mollusca]
MASNCSTLSGWDAELYSDRVNLIGCTTVAGITYGIMLILLVTCAISLLKTIRSPTSERSTRNRAIYQLLYIAVMFILGTLYLSATTQRVQIEYVDHPNVPGGALALTAAVAQDPVSRIGPVVYVLANWMSDCLVLWRVFVLYHGSPYQVWVAIFPFVLFLGVVAVGIIGIVHPTIIDQLFCSRSNLATRAVTLYYGLTLSLSLLSAILVISRVYVHKRRLQKALGPGHGSLYTSVAVMTIESSGLYAVWLLIFLVLYVFESPLQIVFLASLCHVQVR